MPSTTFSTGTTITSTWLNEVDALVWDVFQGATTLTEVQNLLGVGSGLGTMATQDANAVAITGGSISTTTLTGVTLDSAWIGNSTISGASIGGGTLNVPTGTITTLGATSGTITNLITTQSHIHNASTSATAELQLQLNSVGIAALGTLNAYNGYTTLPLAHQDSLAISSQEEILFYGQGSTDPTFALHSSGTLSYKRLQILSPNLAEQAIIFVEGPSSPDGGIGSGYTSIGALAARGHIGTSGNPRDILMSMNTGFGFSIKVDSQVADVLQVTSSAGVVIGLPVGGDKGPNTLNAHAVYDDNVLLSCFVFDAAIDGQIDDAKWDNLVPNRVYPKDPTEFDSEGNPIYTDEVVEEVRAHEPMRKFKSRLGTDTDPLDIDAYCNHWKTKRHLTSMPNEMKFDPVKSTESAGSWIQKLVETVEIQAVHISTLNDRLKVLEGK